MHVPKRDIGAFAREKIALCQASRGKRLQRGSLFRNLFLTGDPDGAAQTYPKTYAYIDNLASWLYSPVDLAFYMSSFSSIDPLARAKNKVAAGYLRQALADCAADHVAGEATLWSLVKGKVFVKMLWSKSGLEPNLIQPEVMGVEQEQLSTLDEQGCFHQTCWYTLDGFANLVSTNPDAADLIRIAGRAVMAGKDGDRPDQANMLKQVVLGGLYPYQAGQGQGNAQKLNGWVDWLGGPTPYLSPELLTSLVQVDELWCWDDDREDYTTIQQITNTEDGTIFGKYQHRNIFADPLDPADKELKGRPNPDNPLKGKHPFVEWCPNPLDGYFWGRSELCNVGLLQLSLNRRIDGINLLLRRQETPPRFFAGVTGATQQTASRLNKPGGWFSEPSPAAKMQAAQPDLPAGLWESFAQLEQMFDSMGGMTPTISGRGESGVRAQAHAETLVRTGTPRFKDRAIVVERSVSQMGDLSLDILKAMDPRDLVAWVDPRDGGLEAQASNDEVMDSPPVEGLKPVKFKLRDLDPDMRVRVDAHSSSPAFVHEARQLLFDLAARGAAGPEELIAGTHPPREDELEQAIERKQAAERAFLAAHPEVALKQAGGGRKR